MTTQIHLVRHAESEHNVSKDIYRPDPNLTDTGLQQADELAQTFPHHRVAIIFTSPLKRTIQTSLGGFGHVLDKTSPRIASSPGIESGARLVVYPDIQPRNARPCDVGSDQEVLEKEFPGLDFSVLSQGWQRKEGLYADEDGVIEERGKRVRKHLALLAAELQGQERRDIALVTHGVVKDILCGKDNNEWPRAKWLTYNVEEDGNGEFKLVQVTT